MIEYTTDYFTLGDILRMWRDHYATLTPDEQAAHENGEGAEACRENLGTWYVFRAHPSVIARLRNDLLRAQRWSLPMAYPLQAEGITFQADAMASMDEVSLVRFHVAGSMPNWTERQRAIHQIAVMCERPYTGGA